MEKIPLEVWRARLEKLGLTRSAALLLDALAPFAPLAAHLLWVAQPSLSLFTDRARIGAWADLLAQPEGLHWLRQELTQHDHE